MITTISFFQKKSELQRKLEQLERQSEQTLRNLAGEIAGYSEHSYPKVVKSLKDDIL